jgi:hypothetical protein
MESDDRVVREGKATLDDLMQEQIGATIEAIVNEELEAVLGAARWTPVEGRDYPITG